MKYDINYYALSLNNVYRFYFLLQTKKHTKPIYKCRKCPKWFNCVKPYRSHLKVCDPIQSDFSSYTSSGKRKRRNRHSKASWTKCSHCSREETSADSLVRHLLIHHEPVACDFCGITLSSISQAQRHLVCKQCLECSFKFTVFFII